MLKDGTFTKIKFRKLFIGAILGWLVSLLGGMADSIIAGVTLDSNAVSAVGLITPIYSVIYFVSILISVGCAIIYSKVLGAFDVKRSEKIAGMGLFVSIIIGLLMAAIMFFGKKMIIGFYGCEGILYEYASAYYNPFIYIAIFYPVYNCLYSLVSYDGDEKTILIVDIAISLINTIASVLLVNKLGIDGLGYGTLISCIVGFLLLLTHFLKKTNSIHFKFYFSFKELFNMLKLSSAMSLTTLYIAVIDIIFNKVIISFYGTEYLPAYTVVNAVLNFAAALICSINAGSVFVSIAYGENNPYSIKRVMKLTQKYMFIMSIVLSVVLIVIAPYWPTIYAISDPEIAKAAVFAGRIIPISYIIAGFCYTYIEYYPVIEKPFEGNILGCMYMLIGPIVLAIPLGKMFGFNGMTIGFFLTPIFAVLILWIVLLIKKQIKLAPYLVEDTDEVETHFDLKLDYDSILELRLHR